ncbi:MAG: O-antigen ligase family protein [Croceibacterium sp.]
MTAEGSIPVPAAGVAVASGLTPRQLATLRILALTPGVFAIITWFGNGTVLHFSLPVVIAQLGLIGCCLSDGLDQRAAFRSARPAALAAVAGLALTATLSTVFVATHPADAALHLGVTMIEMTLGFCLWAAFSSSWTDLRRPVMTALAIGILGQVIVAYSFALWEREVPNFDWIAFLAGTTHVRQLGFYGTALCGLSAGLLATSQSRLGRRGLFLLMTIGFAWNDLSGGRAAFGAGIGGVLLVIALVPQARRRNFAILAGLAFLAAIPLSLIYVPAPSWGLKEILGRLFGFRTFDQFNSGRTVLWIGAFKGFVASPLIGHGEGQFFYEVTHRRWSHPHDSILQYLYQWGIIGTACVLVIAGPIIAGIRKAARAAPEVALPAAGALVGLVLMSLLEGSLYHVFPVMVVVICLAVLASCVGSNARDDAESPISACAIGLSGPDFE